MERFLSRVRMRRLGRSRRTAFAILAALFVEIGPLAGAREAPGAADPPATMSPASPADIAAARALFEKNLNAIRRRDRDAYLACYLQSSRLARTGSTGILLGYESLAASAG